MNAISTPHKAKILGPAKVRFYGRAGPLSERQKEIRLLAKNLGAINLTSVMPADTEHPEAWYKVMEFSEDPIIYAEGIVLREVGQAAVFTSRDCPIVVITEERTGVIGVAHAGRASLMKPNAECLSCDGGILENLFVAMGNPYGENLLVYVTGGISAANFPHEREYVQPFIEKFGADVVPDMNRNTLDLFRVIRKICLRRGVKAKNILSDGICTYDTPWAGSRRAGKDGSNLTFVIKTR